MGTVTGLTAARMLLIEAASIVDGSVDGSGHLILERHDGTTFDAGAIISATGVPFVGQYTTGGRPSAVGLTGKLIWDITLSDFYKSDGVDWILEPMGGGSGSIDDSVYGVAWDSDTTGGASRHALYQKMQTFVDTTTLNQIIPAGIKKIFRHSGTTAGLRLQADTGVAVDPTTRTAGDLWYNGTVDRLKYAGLLGTVRELVNLSQSQTLTNKTLTSPVIDTGVSGTAIETDTDLASDSDTLIPSVKATKGYVDGHDTLVSGTGVTIGAAVDGLAPLNIESVFASKALAIYARAAANQTVTSSTTLVDDATLQLTLLADAIYEISGFIIHDAVTTGDFKIGWAYTGGGTWTFDWTISGLTNLATGVAGAINKAHATIADALIVGGVGAGTKVVSNVSGIVDTDATGGIFKMQFAQGASDPTGSIRVAGSTLIARRIA